MPLWAAADFILIGAPVLICGGVAVQMLLTVETPPLCGLAFFGSPAEVGGASVWEGVRARFVRVEPDAVEDP